MSSRSSFKVFKCAIPACESEFSVIPFKGSEKSEHVVRCPYCGSQDVMIVECLSFTLHEIEPGKIEATGRIQRPEWGKVQDGSLAEAPNDNQLRQR